MAKLFLSAHGRMASGMKSSIEILYGNADCLTVFDAYLPGSNDTVEQHIEEFLASTEESETKLLLSDMVGGSVCQSTMKYIDRPNTYAISGVTLSLLLELVCGSERNYDRDELAELVETSRGMTRLMEFEKKLPDNDSFF